LHFYKNTFRKQTMSNAKKPSVYANAKKFDNKELLAIKEHYKPLVDAWEKGGRKGDRPTPFSLDVANETKSDKMSKNGVRYLQWLVKDLSNVQRPLVRMTIPTLTRSKVSVGQNEEGSTPSSTTFSTRILTDNPDKLEEIAAEFITKRMPDLTGDELKVEIDRQFQLFDKEFDQWEVEKYIDSETLALINDPTYRAKISYNMKKNGGQSNLGNVQYARAPKDGDQKDQEEAAKHDGEIPLAEPIVRYKVKHNKDDGLLWCRVYSIPKVKGAKPQLVLWPAKPGAKPTPLTYTTFTEYLRPGSAIAGSVKYQACITNGKGYRMHAMYQEMVVNRAAKSEYECNVDDELVDSISNMVGNFNNDEEPEAPTDGEVTDEKLAAAAGTQLVKPTLSAKSRMEQQFAEIETDG
jgi:hypothetical protein